MTPDPSAAPTVATFGAPTPSAPPPSGVASGPPRMTPGAFEQAKAVASQAADMAVSPPTPALDPNKMVDMLGKITQIQRQQQKAQQAPSQAPRAPQIEKVASPEERLQRFQKDGNEYGKRIASFLKTHIPGVNFGFTFEVGEDGAVDRIRVGSFLLVQYEDGSEVPHTLAEAAADMDALGEALVQICSATQEALDSMDAGELQKDEW